MPFIIYNTIIQQKGRRNKMNQYQIYKAGPKRGQPKTLTDKVIRFLIEGIDMVEIQSKSSKYRTFINPTKQNYFYFVGKAGAIREGRTISNSRSLTDIIHAKIKPWESAHNKI